MIQRRESVDRKQTGTEVIQTLTEEKLTIQVEGELAVQTKGKVGDTARRPG